jgi:phenylalanyl-tRNA synthetase alpha subunit
LDYEKQQAMAVLQKIVMLTKSFKRDALSKDAETKFNQMNELYQSSSASFQGMFEEQ